MTVQEIISAIGLIGLGGLLKSWLDFFVSDRKRKSETKQQFKETRFKAIILLIHALVNYNTEKGKLLILRPDIKSEAELFNEIYTEWINMTLYASDKVIFTMKNFLKTPSKKSFNEAILAMRKDLYGIKTNIRPDDLLLGRHLEYPLSKT